MSRTAKPGWARHAIGSSKTTNWTILTTLCESQHLEQKEVRSRMMVLSYWEQTYGLLNYGLLHEGLFFETSDEFFGVWESVKAIVPQARERFVNNQ
jgi:hypothetical protein